MQFSSLVSEYRYILLPELWLELGSSLFGEERLYIDASDCHPHREPCEQVLELGEEYFCFLVNSSDVFFVLSDHILEGILSSLYSFELERETYETLYLFEVFVLKFRERWLET